MKELARQDSSAAGPMPAAARGWTLTGAALVAAAALGAGLSPHQPVSGRSAVVLRGTEGDVSSGEPLAVTVEGVTFAVARDIGGRVTQQAVVPWDRVRTIEGPLAPEAARFAPLAERAWRARTRLAREDFGGAEPLYEQLFEEYQSRTGPTAASIAGGLLRCRIARGAQASAIRPWLAWIAAGVTPESGDPVTRIVDPFLGLAPALPPIWCASPGVSALAATVVPEPEPGSTQSAAAAAAAKAAERSRLLLQLYVQAARGESGLEVKLPDLPKNAEDGLRLVSDIVRSRVGSDQTRRDARKALSDRLGGRAASWIEAWCRVAIGRSLLMETDPEAKRQGVLSLLYVASRTGAQDSYVTGIALADAAVGLDAAGDAAGARVLAQELPTRFAGHPALDSPAVQRLIVKVPGASPTGAAPSGDQKP